MVANPSRPTKLSVYFMAETLGYTPPEYQYGGQGNRKVPRPKIQGTQNRWKKEKQQVQRKPITVWNPFAKKQQPPKTNG